MLVPNDFTIRNLINNLRQDLVVEEEQSLFVYSTSKGGKKYHLLKISSVLSDADELMTDVYSRFKSEDGFLYLYYDEVDSLG